MDIEEAIKWLKAKSYQEFCKEPCEIAIEACEKQIAKRVISYSDDESDHVYCPNCNECIGSNEMVYEDFYYRGWSPMYCQECGQAMIWK